MDDPGIHPTPNRNVSLGPTLCIPTRRIRYCAALTQRSPSFSSARLSEEKSGSHTAAAELVLPHLRLLALALGRGRAGYVYALAA